MFYINILQEVALKKKKKKQLSWWLPASYITSIDPSLQDFVIT